MITREDRNVHVRRLSAAQSGPEGEGVVHSAAVHAGAYQLTVLLYDLARSSTNPL